jgi:hypothetical protein
LAAAERVRQLLAAVVTELKVLILYFQPLLQQVVDTAERKAEQRARVARAVEQVSVITILVQVILLALHHHKEITAAEQATLVHHFLVQAAVVEQQQRERLERQPQVAMVVTEQHQAFQVHP